MASSALIECQDVTFGYGEVSVVRGLSTEVRAGEVVAVCGANGAGKTTLLRGMCGLSRLMAGHVLFRGAPSPGRLAELSTRGLALIPDQRAVIRGLTVAENLRLARGEPELGYELFPELDRIRGRRGGLLSGGEQQMLGIASALSRRPRLIMVDELSFGLAPIVTDRLLTALRAAADDGIGVLIVEQRIDLVAKIADRCLVMSDGREAMTCSGSELLDRFAEVASHYLGLGSSLAGSPPQQPPTPGTAEFVLSQEGDSEENDDDRSTW